MSRGVTLAALVACTPVAALAAVYAREDAGGVLVLSDRPAYAGERPLVRDTHDLVEHAVAVRVTAPPGITEKVESAARRHGLDPRLVHAVIRVESGYQVHAVSRKGARGLMQLMPATARRYGVADSFDPAANIEGGVRYLADLLRLFGGRLELALAAYNAGEGAVLRHRGIPPFPESRAYVARVTALYGRALAMSPG